MQTREVILTAGVILVPLVIAVVVTLWSLEQARYRPRKRRPPGIRQHDAEAVPLDSGADGAEADREQSG